MFDMTAGNLRFQAPTPPQTEQYIQNANTEPPQCYQSSIGDSTEQASADVQLPPNANVPQSEDCLFLKFVLTSRWKAQPNIIPVFGPLESKVHVRSATLHRCPW